MVAKAIAVLGGADSSYHQFSEYKSVLEEICSRHASHLILTEDTDILLAENIREFDLILGCFSERSLTAEQSDGLLTALAGNRPDLTGAPKTYFGIHGAATVSSPQQRYEHMLGGRFLAHPPMKDAFTVRINAPEHPLCAGLDSFSIVDELYLMEMYGSYTMLFSARYNGFTCPLAWVKQYGMGRVLCSCLGHGKEQLQHPYLQRVLENGIHWSLL